MGEGDIPSAAIAGAVVAAKGVLRLEGSGEDALLVRLCGAALLLAEAFTGQRLIVRAFIDLVAADGGWHRLTAEPVTALVGDGFAVDIDAQGVGWVRAPATSDSGGVVSVDYSAGLAATWEALPAALAQGVALLAAHLFEHREGDAVPPSAIAALWRPWRRVRIGSSRRCR